MKYTMFKKLSLLLFSILLAAASHAQPCPGGGNGEGGLGSGGLELIAKGARLLKQWVVTAFLPFDPNEINGPKGYAAPQWISVKDRMGYTIHFENDGNFATATAQNVYIQLPVPANININSFRLGSFGFGRFNFEIPENTTHYTKRLDLTDSLGLYVDITAGIDIIQRTFFWSLRSIDSQTGRTPNDLRGFLAVSDTGTAALNDTTSKGKGYVRFLVNAETQSQTGDSVNAKAAIIFDINEPVTTNIWSNYIDALPPSSAVQDLLANQNNITITWTAQDDPGGSGIREYDLYVSEEQGTFRLAKEKVTGNSATYTGTPGLAYSFFTLATDNTGNREALKTTGEKSIILAGMALPVRWLYFTAQPQGDDVLLRWATTQESNTKAFTIERSTNGLDYTAIGTVNAAGNSTQVTNYTFTDEAALILPATKLYYRLQQTDLDGRTEQSRIVIVPIDRNNAEVLIKASPNPFYGIINLQIVTVRPTDKTNWVALYSNDGKQLYSKALNYTGTSTILLQDLPALSNGIYLLQVAVNGKLYTVKMLKQ